MIEYALFLAQDRVSFGGKNALQFGCALDAPKRAIGPARFYAYIERT